MQRTQDGQTTTREAKQRIASVGQAKVNGQKARWIELTLEMDGEPALRTKLLIPEDSFQGERSPLTAVEVAWSERGADAPRRIENPQDETRGPLGMLLPGKLAEVTGLDERTFEVKSGVKITAAGRRGRTRLTDRRGVDELDYRIWSSPKVPFGLVLAEVEELSPDRIADRKVTIRVTAFGTGAKSALPQ